MHNKEKYRNHKKFLGVLLITYFIYRGASCDEVITGPYFASDNTETHFDAGRFCESKGGTLLNIETEEELKNVTEYLLTVTEKYSDIELPIRFWTDGTYNNTILKYVWRETNLLLGPWVVWDEELEEHPEAADINRISIVFPPVDGNITFLPKWNTENYHYICEFQAKPKDQVRPCYSNNDLIFVLDSSKSVGENNYKSALDFIAKVAVAWVDNPGNRISLIVFSCSAHSIFTLNDFPKTPTEVRKQVYNTPYFGGKTATHLALNQVIDEFTEYSRDELQDVMQNVIFLTDGGSCSPSDTEVAIKTLHANEIQSFVIGISDRVRNSELNKIAGSTGNVYKMDTFDNFDELLPNISRDICEKSLSTDS